MPKVKAHHASEGFSSGTSAHVRPKKGPVISGRRDRNTAVIVASSVFVIFVLIVSLLFGVVLGTTKTVTQELGSIRDELAVALSKVDLLTKGREKQARLYSIIDVEARDGRGVETLTPVQKRLVAETLLKMENVYAARGHSLALYCAIIKQESRWQPRVSSVGWNARGLMQLLDSTMKFVCDYLVKAGDNSMIWRGPEDSYDPVKNVTAGAQYLDIVHQVNVSLGREKQEEIGWHSIYEYYAGGRALNSFLASKKDTAGGMPYVNKILEYVKVYNGLGL